MHGWQREAFSEINQWLIQILESPTDFVDLRGVEAEGHAAGSVLRTPGQAVAHSATHPL